MKPSIFAAVLVAMTPGRSRTVGNRPEGRPTIPAAAPERPSVDAGSLSLAPGPVAKPVSPVASDAAALGGALASNAAPVRQAASLGSFYDGSLGKLTAIPGVTSAKFNMGEVQSSYSVVFRSPASYRLARWTFRLPKKLDGKPVNAYIATEGGTISSRGYEIQRAMAKLDALPGAGGAVVESGESLSAIYVTFRNYPLYLLSKLTGRVPAVIQSLPVHPLIRLGERTVHVRGYKIESEVQRLGQLPGSLGASLSSGESLSSIHVAFRGYPWYLFSKLLGRVPEKIEGLPVHPEIQRGADTITLGHYKVLRALERFKQVSGVTEATSGRYSISVTFDSVRAYRLAKLLGRAPSTVDGRPVYYDYP